ncbi:2Fe-2S iron-sulfur cluster-binding protein [Alkalimarinus alittae]|uniref:2Fe-2S iron-sulfur cluster-binding protein n=1 Tax=Alkalimarinus alittae TaxID=2961619 RepID=A0ABY6N2W8_9ALTE|nr:2Fe-2S iron-sulfur cluster-binding protein [Alkalimarinus alittae]UZE96448.1 2Fe-2S iron-sulfur cluster-binding protein [Alkalimarinus alittae]
MSLVRLLPRDIEFECLTGETVFDAAFRQGIRFPVSCENGVCHICQGTLLLGRCALPNGIKVEAVNKELMLCKAVPETDCDIEINGVLKPGEIALKTFACQVEAIEELNHDVYRVVLRPPAGKRVEFYAGQYLSVLMDGRDPSFFSIASVPTQPDEPANRNIELHVQAAEGWESASAVINFIKTHSVVKVQLPFGKACLVEPVDQPLLLIAAGTGFAQMQSIIEQALSVNPEQKISLYWGGRQANDIYMLDKPEEWKKTYANFSCRTISGDTEDNEWPGHHEQLFNTVLKDGHDLKECQVFASGSPGMVYATMDAFLEKGMPAENFHSDVLEYAPR